MSASSLTAWASECQGRRRGSTDDEASHRHDAYRWPARLGQPAVQWQSALAANSEYRSSRRVRRAAGSRLCVQVLQSYEMLARDMPMQGTTRSGYIHATDWYATFLTLAGLSAAEIANDARAAAAHLPAIDSINMLSFLFRTLTARLLPRALGPRSRSTAPSRERVR